MEILRGTIIIHNFVVTHPHRISAEEFFGGDRILDAVPTEADHVSATLKDDQMSVVCVVLPEHQRPDLIMTEEAPVIREIFSAFKEGETLEHQLKSGADPALKTWLPDFCRLLYYGDILELRAPTG